jgi:hypothetical protein
VKVRLLLPKRLPLRKKQSPNPRKLKHLRILPQLRLRWLKNPKMLRNPKDLKKHQIPRRLPERNNFLGVSISLDRRSAAGRH